MQGGQGVDKEPYGPPPKATPQRVWLPPPPARLLNMQGVREAVLPPVVLLNRIPAMMVI